MTPAQGRGHVFMFHILVTGKKMLSSKPKTTALIEEQRQAGGKFMLFQGWKLPREFSSSRKEHLNVRKNAGLFDISHMGEIRVQGPGALPLLQKTLTNQSDKLKKNQAQYNLMCNEKGGVIDDLLLYCLEPEKDYLLCVNAGCSEKDFQWLSKHNMFQATLKNESDKWAGLSIQGPKALSLLIKALCPSHDSLKIPARQSDLPDYSPTSRDLCPTRAVPLEASPTLPESREATLLKNMKKNQCQWFSPVSGGTHFQMDTLNKTGVHQQILVSATGYTGERGFEIFLPPQSAPVLWQKLLEVGKGILCPAGLSARDTLRLESQYPLYGQELSEDRDPYSAGLSWAVKNKTNFIGSQALSKTKITNKRVSFVLSQGESALSFPRSSVIPAKAGICSIQELSFPRRRESHSFILSQSKSTDFVSSSQHNLVQKEEQKNRAEQMSSPLRVPRTGNRILAGGQPIGEVTSGAFSPTLSSMIGMGYVQAEQSASPTKIQVEIQGDLYPAFLVPRFLP